jgi:hypothetical protein
MASVWMIGFREIARNTFRLALVRNIALCVLAPVLDIRFWYVPWCLSSCEIITAVLDQEQFSDERVGIS